MQWFFHQALGHVQLSFQVMQSNGYFSWCVQTASKQVNEDEDQQSKA